MKKALFLLVMFAVLTGCGTVNYINIETFKPAEVTFPAMVKKVLIVNNAVPQPEKSGYEYKLMGILQDTARVKADSALFDIGRSLGISILDTNYFNDVLLFHEGTRKNNNYLSDEKLTQAAVRALCEETNADAVISIDRLLFDMTKATASFSSDYYLGFVSVKVASVIRAYIPDRETPLATVLMSDSLSWSDQAETIKKLDSYLPSPEGALRESAKYIGSLAAPNFVPHWDNEVRWFYSDMASEWKQASAYASAQKWDAAEQIWLSVYKKTRSETSKAKLASNIAFAKEMQGDYAEALEWAEKARLSFLKKGESTRDYKLLKQYAEALEKRINENRKLNIQIGES